MVCTKCENPTAGKSRYCESHRAESRANFKAMIADSAAERGSREQKHLDLYNQAHAAGMAAGEAHSPVPMVVVQHAHPLDDNSAIVKVYEPVMGGVCGFAWITVRPGNSSFALWLVKSSRARKAYQGGVQVRVGEFGQSMEKKEAYASAFAEVLRNADIKAYAGSRMD